MRPAARGRTEPARGRPLAGGQTRSDAVRRTALARRPRPSCLDRVGVWVPARVLRRGRSPARSRDPMPAPSCTPERAPGCVPATSRATWTRTSVSRGFRSRHGPSGCCSRLPPSRLTAPSRGRRASGHRVRGPVEAPTAPGNRTGDGTNRTASCSGGIAFRARTSWRCSPPRSASGPRRATLLLHTDVLDADLYVAVPIADLAAGRFNRTQANLFFD